MKRVLLLLTLLVSFNGFAQMTGWEHALPITITNNSASQGINFTVDITVNTAQYVSAGQMLATGADIRFGTACGAQLYSYYINSGMNTSSTSITIKIPSLAASSSATFYMFYDNAAAAPAATIAAFSGPFSSVNQLNPLSYNSGGVTNSQRGFRFTPNSDVFVTSFGKNDPNGTTRYVTLFNYNTQAIIHQEQVSGPSGTYSYQPLTNPIWLTQGATYVMEIFQGASDGYYYGAPGPANTNTNLTFITMQYCNGCTQNTFPTSSGIALHYGYVDFQFYLKAPLAPLPTVTLGTATGLASATISSNVGNTICPGQSATFTATTPEPYTSYAWDKNGSPVGTNIDNYTENTFVAGDMVTLTVTDDVLCVPAASNTETIAIHPTPTVVVTSTDPSICIGSNTTIDIALTGPTPFNFNYFDGVGNITQPAHNSNTFSFSVSPSVPTSYYVNSVIDGNNCSALVADLMSTAIVAVDDSTLITNQPLDIATCSGTSATFSVVATGTGLTYQWYNGTTPLSNGIDYAGVASPSLTVNNATGMDNMEFYTIASGTCGADKYSDTVMLTELTTNTWTGTTSSLWSVPTNWSCGAVPIVTTDVIIPSSATNMPNVNIPGAICNTITVDAGASLGFASLSSKLEVKGDITNNGTIQSFLGKILLSGTDQMVTGGIAVADLEISGGGNKTITANMTLYDVLTLNNGYLILGENDLRLEAPWEQVGGSAASFVVTNDTGSVIAKYLGNDTNPESCWFHVGINTSSYTPMYFENTGDQDTFDVRVIEKVYQDGYGVDPAEVVEPVVDRTWFINEFTPGGSFANITLYWNGGEETNNFDLAHVYVVHYMNNEWTNEIDSAIWAPAAAGTDPYSAMEDSITSFSPFSVASYAQFPLAIRLTTISASNSGIRNKVEWKSATEAIGDKYELEHSTDARSFKQIETIAATGKADMYTQWHENPAIGVNYYRVKIVDASGKFRYSKVVTATVTATDAFGIEAFPNPVKNTVSVKVNGTVKGKGNVTITDVTGRVVKAAVEVNNNKADINVGELSSGVYLLNYTDDIHTESVKINKQ